MVGVHVFASVSEFRGFNYAVLLVFMGIFPLYSPASLQLYPTT